MKTRRRKRRRGTKITTAIRQLVLFLENIRHEWNIKTTSTQGTQTKSPPV